MRKTALFIVIFLIPVLLWSKDSKKKGPEIEPQKTVQAVRTNDPITIDGVLDENVWQKEGYSDFTMSDPNDGEQPTEKTEVWVAYDEKALYIAARLYDSQPELIKGRLGRRDDFVDSDWFIFAVDTYYDRRSGYQFAVNPSGSIVDWTLYNDIYDDSTWDGVWDWKTMLDESGWTVEIRIPYNQLRFPKKNEYVWGVDFRRVIKRKNERVGFVWVPKEDTAYVSRFAKLEGIHDIRPGRHIELLPYAVSQGEFSQEDPGNPFETGKNFMANTGLDMKISLKSNLTLDATVNPDFGQVEVDPAVINLSDYETYYSEKRPFFIEGMNIFDEFGRGGDAFNLNINWPNPTFFYSRRIGRAPQGYVTQSGYTNYPDRSTILGAFKLSGKMGKGWNFGFINALTAREFAEIDSSGDRFHEEVEPLSYYGVLRGQKEFSEGKRGLGFLATSVIRDLRKDTLAEILNDRAFSLAIDGWTFLDKKQQWVITGWFGGTRVEGSQDAISRLQRSSLHYYQRPDATHIEVDPNATSLMGWGARVALNKQKGRFLFGVAIGALSPGFDPNDIGFQFGSSDVINYHMVLAYRWPHPGKVFRNLIIFGGPFGTYDFGGNKTWQGALVSIEGQFLNYWNFSTMVAYNPKTLSKTLTRGGPLARVPQGYQIDFGMNTDSRKPIVISGGFGIYKRPDWWGSYSRGGGVSLPLSGTLRLNWTFTPKLTLQLYLQPFLAVGQYNEFKELARPRSFDYNIYGEGSSTISFSDDNYYVDPDGPGPAPEFSFSNPDFNYKSLRGTIVLRWEYTPGSRLYFVWTQNRADFANPGNFNLGRDLGDLFSAPGDNIFMIKISYRWNI
jgi:hypothetical protein